MKAVRALLVGAIILAPTASPLRASGQFGWMKLNTPSPAKFHIEEATIEGIQSEILKGRLTSTQVVEMYLQRIKAYDGRCVNMPEGLLGPFTTIKHAGQINALITVNLRPANRAAYGIDAHKARSMTDALDNNPDMPDALEI